jgi:uncharacterized membrane protein
MSPQIVLLAAAEHTYPAEETIKWMVQWLKLGVETIGALLVAIGVIVAVVQLCRHISAPRQGDFSMVRLSLARYLALALEFQLGADILTTAIAPTWDQIGKLGAIAVIRTLLNYFLSLEMKGERKETTSPHTAS